MALDPEFVALLRCPKCRGALLRSSHRTASPAKSARLSVDDDLPNFLVEQANRGRWPSPRRADEPSLTMSGPSPDARQDPLMEDDVDVLALESRILALGAVQIVRDGVEALGIMSAASCPT